MCGRSPPAADSAIDRLAPQQKDSGAVTQDSTGLHVQELVTLQCALVPAHKATWQPQRRRDSNVQRGIPGQVRPQQL